VTNFKNGALIAIAAGSLFAAACKKKEESSSMDKPMAGEMKTGDMGGDMKAADMKGDMKAGDMKESADMKGESMAAAKPDMAGEKMAKVHCAGVNACKGHGACKGEANACGGKNGCAGKGWVEMSEDECKAKNGTILANK
jgi:hypothetical protein